MNRILINGLFNAAKRDLRKTQTRGILHPTMDEPFKAMQATNHARQHGEKLWSMLTYYMAIPSVIIFSVYMYFVEQEHSKHPREPFVEYEWRYHRKRNFPWGDGKHSLFHNPIKNALPGVGYEVPDPNEGHGH